MRKSNEKPKKAYSGSQIVKIVGKYLFNKIDGAYNFKIGANTYDVYITVLYQLRDDDRKDDEENINEMDINISITTYSDKLRVNVIEISPREKTLGFSTFSIEKFDNLEYGCNIVMERVRRFLEREYIDHDFIF